MLWQCDVSASPMEPILAATGFWFLCEASFGSCAQRCCYLKVLHVHLEMYKGEKIWGPLFLCVVTSTWPQTLKRSMGSTQEDPCPSVIGLQRGLGG